MNLIHIYRRMHIPTGPGDSNDTINDTIRVTCVAQPEHKNVAATMLSEAVKSASSPPSLCSAILKAIVSLFVRHQPATVELLSSSTSIESIVLADDVHTQLIPSTNTNHTQHYSQHHQHHHPHQTPVAPYPPYTVTTEHCTIHSQSTQSLYFTTQPSSTFSFYSCSSCSSSFMASASSCASTTLAPPLPPFIVVSPTTTFNNSSAGHFRPICINVNADDSRVYRRLLVQLEETERRFDDFWNTHLIRLKQCLDLRRFEQDFRELQVTHRRYSFQSIPFKLDLALSPCPYKRALLNGMLQ